MPKAILSRKEEFCASHRLHAEALSAEENQRIFGKCNHENGHGHNYEVIVKVFGDIDPKTGLVMDLSELKAAMQRAIIAKVDHKHLNLDVEEFKALNPTAENMAVVFWDWMAKEISESILYEVAVQETRKNLAIYRGHPSN